MSESPLPVHRRRRGTVLAIVLVVVLAVLAGLAWFGWSARQSIADFFSARDFAPSAEIEAVVAQTTMTDDARAVFYATHPIIDATQDFNADCEQVERGSEGSNLLGCYVQSAVAPVLQDRIFLFGVTEERLTGVVEVAAAHELLHAAYARLGEAERADLNELLFADYERLAAENPALAERMAAYGELSEARLANELHSILGTEVSVLSPELEEHYTRYFEDRSAVVALYDGYRAVFDDLRNRMTALESELVTFGDGVRTRSDAYTVALDRLNADIADFNLRARTTGAATAAERDALEARIDDLAAERDALSADVARYDELRQQLIALGSESEALGNTLDSTLAPPPSIG